MADKMWTTDLQRAAQLVERATSASDDNAADRADEAGIQADAELVKRCLAGEVNAWESLYAGRHDAGVFHPFLVGNARPSKPGRRNRRPCLVHVGRQRWRDLDTL